MNTTMWSFRSRGRADGIFTEDGAVYIDEIKGTYGNVQAMDMPIPVHRAQAMCYGLIWGEKEGFLKSTFR